MLNTTFAYSISLDTRKDTRIRPLCCGKCLEVKHNSLWQRSHLPVTAGRLFCHLSVLICLRWLCCFLMTTGHDVLFQTKSNPSFVCDKRFYISHSTTQIFTFEFSSSFSSKLCTLFYSLSRRTIWIAVVTV